MSRGDTLAGFAVVAGKHPLSLPVRADTYDNRPHVKVHIGHAQHRGIFSAEPFDGLIDTGSRFTFIPRKVARALEQQRIELWGSVDGEPRERSFGTVGSTTIRGERRMGILGFVAGTRFWMPMSLRTTPDVYLPPRRRQKGGKGTASVDDVYDKPFVLIGTDMLQMLGVRMVYDFSSGFGELVFADGQVKDALADKVRAKGAQVKPVRA